MKWPTKPKPQMGATRVVSRFVWWPLSLDNETRWLTWTKIVQTYTYFFTPTEHVDGIIVKKEKFKEDWVNTHWFDRGYEVIDCSNFVPWPIKCEEFKTDFTSCEFIND
jgi:hypothetical protein